MRNVKNYLLLFLTALIWGCAFVAQSVGMEHVGPLTFNAVRMLIGGAVLLLALPLLDRVRGRRTQPDANEEGAGNAAGKSAAPTDAAARHAGSDRSDEVSQKARTDRRNLWTGGILCGLALTLASTLQQYGILHTTVGKAGFITALYIVLVPVLGIFLGKKVRPLIVLCICMSVVGLYLLCMKEKLALGTGDLMVLLCAAVFSVHILLVDHYSPLTDGVRLSCIQFFTCGIISGILMLFFEKPQPAEILAAAVPILYAGVLSCGVGYTLQIVGQKDVDPTIASMILSLESVFSVLAGWVILQQKLSGREISGCVLMFAAILLAQTRPGKKQVPEQKPERN